MRLTGLALPAAYPAGLGQAAGDAYNEAEEDEDGEGEAGGPLGEVHEVLGNGLMLLVTLHVSYLVLFKRPLARFMLFTAAKTKSQANP